MSPVLYRKWRPQALAEVVGQEPVTQTLLQALHTERVAHAYLFSGPRGTGKTSTGRILAKAVNCLTDGRGEPCNQCALCQAITQGSCMDVIEVDAASNRGIDEIRSLREKAAYAAGVARYKVYIIDEVHMLTEPAANALLKTLEEPPPHVIFVLATTEPHKVPATIISRCQHFDFRRLSQAAVVSRLAYICQKEGIAISEEALRLVARSAAGSLRDATNLVEQLVAHYGSNPELHQVKEMLGLSGDVRARELAQHLLARDLSAGLAVIHQASSDGLDLRQFHRQVVNYLRDLLLLRAGSEEAVEATPEDLAEMKKLVARASLAELVQAVKRFSELELRRDSYSPLPLEMALVEFTLPAREETRPRAEAEPRASVVSPQRPASVAVGRAASPRASPPETAVRPAATSSPPDPIPASAPSPAKGAPEEAAAPGPPTMDHIRQHWREFINSLRGEGSTGTLDALLRNSCRPMSLEGTTLVLGFFWELHKSKIEDPKYSFLIERKLSQFFGVPYKLRCVLTPKKPSPLVEAALQQGARLVSREEK